MKSYVSGFLLCCTSFAFAQSTEGFWDNIRTTNETLIVNAGNRKVVKTSDFPAGTTEMVYRISLLDDNQKISSSLVSVLKAIPDPTGITQGTAGAVFLASTISGNDKCTFAVFANESDALNYEKTGVIKNACITQDEPVNKAARLLSEKSKCILGGARNLWFGFQSDNWVMKEKIVLEVVPWVNYNLRSGWTAENKKEVLKLAEKLEITSRLSNKELFLGNFITGFVAKYPYDDYKKLLAVEKTKLITDVAEESLLKSGQLNSYLDAIRKEAEQLMFAPGSEEGISKMQTEIVNKNRAVAADYFLIGTLYLSAKQFSKAEEALLKAIEMNKSDVSFELKLAHVYMFTDQLSKAKDIHKKYRQNYFPKGKSWLDQTKTDFQKFEENGFDTRNFKKILRILE